MVNTGGRLLNSLRAGYLAARQTWNSANVLATRDAYGRDQWDWYATRLQRYNLWQDYYEGVQYETMRILARRVKIDTRLYKHIRNIYNPIGRVVDLYGDFVYGGNLNYENPEMGAIPIGGADPYLLNAISKGWQMSGWQNNKDNYAKTGAKLGDSLIKIVDDRRRGEVRMETLSPAKVFKVEMDAVGRVEFLHIQYEDMDDDGQTFTYGEIWKDPREDLEFDVIIMRDDKIVNQWKNEYGFVPAVKCKFQDEGFEWGAPPFFGQPIRKVDEINDVVSPLNDNIRKTVNVPYFFTGVSKTDLVNMSMDDRDKTPALYTEKEAHAIPLVVQLQIAEVSQHVASMYDELMNDLPELALAVIRENDSRMTAPGVATGWADGEMKIINARGKFDGALVEAQKMMCAIAGFNGLPGFERYNLESYSNGALEHTIKERAVIAEKIGKYATAKLMQEAQIDPRFWLEYVNVDDDKIKEIVKYTEQHAREELAAFLQSGMGLNDNNGDMTNADTQASTDGTPNADGTPNGNRAGEQQPTVTGSQAPTA